MGEPRKVIVNKDRNSQPQTTQVTSRQSKPTQASSSQGNLRSKYATAR
jgi:hypothetical protein